MVHYKRYSIILQIVMFCLGCYPAAMHAQQKATKKAPERVVFFEDFSGKKLDRSKWQVIVTGYTVNNEQQAYVDSSYTIALVNGAAAEGAKNGALEIRPRYSPGFVTKEGKTFDFISGRIESRDKVEFTYGTASARIKLTDGAGLWPAWWLLGNGDWPAAGEVDILEYVGEKDWASAAVHGPGYSGETPFVNRLYLPPNNDVTNWHVYAVECTPDSLIFKYDDMPMFRVTRPMVEHYGKWCFDNAKFLILNFALGGGYPVKINGAKQPYFGLPASTVELVKQHKSKMLVDWVKITTH